MVQLAERLAFAPETFEEFWHSGDQLWAESFYGDFLS
jgi:hypothetical protein